MVLQTPTQQLLFIAHASLLIKILAKINPKNIYLFCETHQKMNNKRHVF